MNDGGPFTLLVVDDEKGIVDFTVKIYSKKGFKAFGATDGASALEIFKRERPHISLIDIHMPYSPFDGVETLRKIKEIDKDALCIMVTRITENKSVEDSRALGAAAYVSKPLRVEELDKVINETLKLIR